MLRAAVFDLDGTLVETAPDLHRVLAMLCAEEGIAAPSIESLRAMVGDGARVLLSRAFAAAGVELPEERHEALYARFLELYVATPAVDSWVYQGVVEALEELRTQGWRLGVCTNKPQLPSDLLLQQLGLAPFFGSILGGDALPVRKPDPAHLGGVVAALGSVPGRTIMVGDSRNDLLAARGLGCRCILVSFGYTTVPAAELGADRVIDSFAELTAAIASLDGDS